MRSEAPRMAQAWVPLESAGQLHELISKPFKEDFTKNAGISKRDPVPQTSLLQRNGFAGQIAYITWT